MWGPLKSPHHLYPISDILETCPECECLSWFTKVLTIFIRSESSVVCKCNVGESSAVLVIHFVDTPPSLAVHRSMVLDLVRLTGIFLGVQRVRMSRTSLRSEYLNLSYLESIIKFISEQIGSMEGGSRPWIILRRSVVRPLIILRKSVGGLASPPDPTCLKISS